MHENRGKEQEKVLNLRMEYKELKELMIRNRSYRRFDGSKTISEKQLEELVELCRYCASGRNMQPLKYRLVTADKENDEIFPLLAWAGYLADWQGPEKGEMPTAYIIQCLDLDLTENPMCDDGLQLEAITLGAVSVGLGSCIIKSFNKQKLKEVLSLPGNLEPLHVLALGFPIEEVVIDDMNNGDIKYWRDKDRKHHVPKRRLQEILVK